MHIFWSLDFTFVVFYMSGITHFCGNFQPLNLCPRKLFIFSHVCPAFSLELGDWVWLQYSVYSTSARNPSDKQFLICWISNKNLSFSKLCYKSLKLHIIAATKVQECYPLLVRVQSYGLHKFSVNSIL